MNEYKLSGNYVHLLSQKKYCRFVHYGTRELSINSLSVWWYSQMSRKKKPLLCIHKLVIEKETDRSKLADPLVPSKLQTSFQAFIFSLVSVFQILQETNPTDFSVYYWFERQQRLNSTS
jgi:hypothetical protein